VVLLRQFLSTVRCVMGGVNRCKQQQQQQQQLQQCSLPVVCMSRLHSKSLIVLRGGS
jgi:hypothetical protein